MKEEYIVSTELIIGRAKSGKSHYLQEKVESIHAQMPKTNIYYLTPEQTTFSVEYALSSSEKLHGFGHERGVELRAAQPKNIY